MKHAPLLTLLLTLGVTGASGAGALVRLGNPLPAHPWADSERELIVIYSHDCGDLGHLWDAILNSGLPVHAVNAEQIASPAPQGVNVWRGQDATTFARKLRLSAYPTVLLVHEGRILNAWEGDFTGNLEVGR